MKSEKDLEYDKITDKYYSSYAYVPHVTHSKIISGDVKNSEMVDRIMQDNSDQNTNSPIIGSEVTQ